MHEAPHLLCAVGDAVCGRPTASPSPRQGLVCPLIVKHEGVPAAARRREEAPRSRGLQEPLRWVGVAVAATSAHLGAAAVTVAAARLAACAAVAD